MIIIGTYQHSIGLEQTLAVLEQYGISKSQILVVPMNSEPEHRFPFLKKSKNPYSNGVEVGVACATGLSVIGASLGFILPLGPILCGLIAAFLGFGIGFGIHQVLSIKSYGKPFSKQCTEIIVIVQCKEEDSTHVQEMMWAYDAMTVGKNPGPSQPIKPSTTF